ncbi:MAG: CDP-alcohol phosphatidyltransferase family protein [Bdellovibrionota bacterium]
MPFSVILLFIVNGGLLSFFVIFALFMYPHRQVSDETKNRQKSFVSNAVFREYWYTVIGPFKKKLVDWNISPNTITFWGFILSLVAGYFFSIGEFGTGGWFVILAATCDIYDGQLARLRSIKLKSGAFLDSTLDRVGEVGIFYGLTRYFRNDDPLFIVIFLGFAASQVVSYSRSRAEGLGFPELGQRGFFQRAERMIVLSVCMSMAPLLEYFWGYGTEIVKFGIYFICLGSTWTAITRSTGIFRGMRRAEKTSS